MPSKLIREVVEARFTSATVEIFHKSRRIASHAFLPVRNRHSTTPEHMPSAHRRHTERTPAKMMDQATKIAGIAKALEEQRRQPDFAALPFEDRLGLLVDREAIDRENNGPSAG